MRKIRLKNILLTTGSVFVLLIAVLCIHIYMVTRPKAPDENTIVMARIDLKQPITDVEAQKITAWMYLQKGIDHVMCNAAMKNVVFTFRPLHGDGNEIVSNFKSEFNFSNAVRYVPTEADLKSGCPVSPNSISYKFYSFFRKLM